MRSAVDSNSSKVSGPFMNNESLCRDNNMVVKVVCRRVYSPWHAQSVVVDVRFAHVQITGAL